MKRFALILLCCSFVSATALLKADVQPQHHPSSTENPQEPTGLAIVDYKTLEVVHSQAADYPRAAKRAGVQGEVVIKLLLSKTGSVEQVEVVSGDPLLTDAAIKAAKKFRFKPLVRNGRPVEVSTTIPFDFYLHGNLMPTKEIRTEAPKDSVPESLLTACKAERIDLNANIAGGMLIRNIRPAYPKEAKRNHIQGKVVLSAVIGKDGRIKELRAISGPEELIPPSIGAVQQWLYKPYLLCGQPVEVDTQVTVTFALSQ